VAKTIKTGFLNGCKDAGNSEETYQSAEDNQD